LGLAVLLHGMTAMQAARIVALGEKANRDAIFCIPLPIQSSHGRVSALVEHCALVN
jgi:hypothetical protein